MLPSEPEEWLAPLREAYAAPWIGAQRWRAHNGRVVGLLGGTAPRELVLAGGMLPVRLRPRRLHPGPPATLPAGLARELSPELAPVLAALLGGRLGWLDALLIGRDTEAHTKLFYVLRELAGEPGVTLPPFAFADILRLPHRTSSHYNRLRMAELRETVGGWTGRRLTGDQLAAAVADGARTAQALRELDRLRAQRRVTGTEALIAVGAAQMVTGEVARAALAQAAAARAGDRVQPAEGPALFVTGSDHDDPWAYELIEGTGAVIVGDDHGWTDDGHEAAAATPDALDGIVDRCQLSSRGSARAGLDRVAATVTRVRRSGAAAVLQIIAPGDGSPGWELPALRAQLPDLPVASVSLAGEAEDPAVLADALAALAGRAAESHV